MKRTVPFRQALPWARVLACFLLGNVLWAEPASISWVEPETLLGLTLEQGFKRFGPPQQVGVARGTEPWQDDVVFVYPGGVSLFWFKDRVWQVRLSPAFSGTVRGVRIGDTWETVQEVLGPPYFMEKDWVLYHFEMGTFPARLRIFFQEGVVEDLYLYRADF